MTNSTDFSYRTDQETRIPFNAKLFEEEVHRQSAATADAFKSITRYYALFHLFFVGLILVEVFSFFLFFSLLSRSSLLAVSLAAIFLTLFSYLVLLFYFQAKKPEQLIELKNSYSAACLRLLPTENSPERHLSLAYAYYRLTSELHDQEYNYYQLPPSLKALEPLAEKFSLWAHWKDVHDMKEMLLFLAIEEHVKLVKAEPTDLEAHASLAGGFISLYKLYMDPRKQFPGRQFTWVSSEYASEKMEKRFKAAAQRAIEEFKILDAYAPGDPWVHAQLASIYHDLEMPEEETLQYEALQKISPQDKTVLFRLGTLYFEQGKAAAALRLYQELRTANDPAAEELISYYDKQLQEI